MRAGGAVQEFAGLRRVRLDIDAEGGGADRRRGGGAGSRPWGPSICEDNQGAECSRVRRSCRRAHRRYRCSTTTSTGTSITFRRREERACSLTPAKRIEEVKIGRQAGRSQRAPESICWSRFCAAAGQHLGTGPAGRRYEGRPVLMTAGRGVYAQNPTRPEAGGSDRRRRISRLSAPALLKPRRWAAADGARPEILGLAHRPRKSCRRGRFKAVRTALICTGRSDFHNQVNHVVLSYIFRGAIDVGRPPRSTRHEDRGGDAIAALAREAPSEVAARALGGEARPSGRFGSLIPNRSIPA